MFKRIFSGSKKNSSSKVAKDRLKIIIAHQRGQGESPVDMAALEADILEAIKKHIDIDEDDFDANLNDGELDISIALGNNKDQERSKRK